MSPEFPAPDSPRFPGVSKLLGPALFSREASTREWGVFGYGLVDGFVERFYTLEGLF